VNHVQMERFMTPAIVDIPEQAPGTWVVTGAGRGIGLNLVALLKKKGHSVYALCRNESEELSRIGVNVVTGVDMTDDSLGTTITQKLSSVPRIDVLVNVAGIVDEKLSTMMAVGGKSQSFENLSMANMRLVHEVNLFGPTKIIQACLGKLVAGSKIVNISTVVASIAINKNGVLPIPAGVMNAYRCSKAALNMLTRSVAEELGEKGISAVAVHPGLPTTEMFLGRGSEALSTDMVPPDLKAFMCTPEQAADNVYKCVAVCGTKVNGRFLEGRPNGVVEIPW